MSKSYRRIVIPLVFLIVCLPLAAFADSAEQLIHSTDAQLGTAFGKVTFLQATTPEAFIVQFDAQEPALAASLAQATTNFTQASKTATDGGVQHYAGQFAQDTSSMSKALTEIQNALSASDGIGLDSGISDLQTAMNFYHSDATDYDQYLPTAPNIPANGKVPPAASTFVFFLVVSVAIALAAFLFWITASVPEGDVAGAERKRLRGGLVFAAIFPVIGSGGTYIWYRYMADHGGTYFILYGPVLVGFASLIVRGRYYRRVVAAQKAGQMPLGSSGSSGYGFPGGAGAGRPAQVGDGGLMPERIRYMPKSVGRGSRAIATLTREGVQVTGRRDQRPIVFLPIGEIDDVRSSGLNLLKISARGQVHRLVFSGGGFLAFVLLGVLLSGARGRTRAWARAIDQLRAQARTDQVPSGWPSAGGAPVAPGSSPQVIQLPPDPPGQREPGAGWYEGAGQRAPE